MYLTLDQALRQEVKEVHFVLLDGKVVGRKLENELFLEFDIDLQTAKLLKEILKAYKPTILPDSNGRFLLITKTNQIVRFNHDMIYYEGVIKPVFFPKNYTSDALHIRPSSLLALNDLDTAIKKYEELQQ